MAAPSVKSLLASKETRATRESPPHSLMEPAAVRRTGPLSLDGFLTPIEVSRLSQVKLRHGATKLAVYAGVVSACWTALLLSDHAAVVIAAVFGLGIFYAHGLELQHECLHLKLLPSRRWSRVVGFVLGAPMLVSYTHYRTMHLHHHKFLGTPQDAEIFDYDQSSLDSWPKFLARAWNLARVPTFFRTLLGFIRGRYAPQFRTPEARQKVTLEYFLLLLLLFAAVASSVVLQTPKLAIGWFAAWLIVGEPAHFFIELPEHMGCDKSVRDVFSNTRYVAAPRLLQYITNRNNYHVEHHLYPGICPRHLHIVHEALEAHILHHDSYPSFFLKILKRIGKPA
jgi:fatty acid desaturase